MKFLNLLNSKSISKLVLLIALLICGSSHFRLSAQCSLACNGATQVSLDSNCEAIITPAMILQDSTSCMMGDFLVEVRDEYEQIISTSPIVTADLIGKIVSAKIMDTNSGNSCWGFITVEDKLGPVATCPTPNVISINCAVMDAYTGPEFIDNCDGVVEPVLLSESIETLCDANFIKKVTRTYTAFDSRGTKAPMDCTVEINLERIDTSVVLYPEDFVARDNTQLDCSGQPWDLNGNNYPDPEEVGVPQYPTNFNGTLDTLDLFPFPDVYCNTVVTITDTELPTIGCTRKIIRRYELREWHCMGEVVDVHIQTIEITDRLGPELICGQNITVTTNTLTGSQSSVYGNVTCGATVNLGLPTVSDNCTPTENITFDLLYPGGTTFDYDLSSQVTLQMGLSIVEFTAYDECYNSSKCNIHVNVVDNTPPVAVCDQHTVVSLTTGGEAVVHATSFDDGSYDDCKDHCMLVRRMTPGTCEQKIPEFCDLRYVGTDNGSYYYLSNYDISADIAKGRASAYGGSLVVFDSEEEEEFVVDAVRSIYAGRFWTGAKRFGSGFLWDDHTELEYTNWGPGQPSNDPGEDCVMVTPNNDWNDASCFGEWRYVLEIKDINGFSRIANFCCSDVLEEQMVVFRVVDLFGNFNECMVNVNVQDKLAPQLICPADQTVDCDLPYDMSNLDLAFGTATVLDDCGNNAPVENPDNQTNQCNIGQLVRVFTATDNGGLSSTCKQVITFENDDVFDFNDIVCPRDTTIIGCTAATELTPELLGTPTYSSDNCDLIGVDFDDEVFTFNNQSTDACLKVLRTFNIVDWCQNDTVSGLYPIFSCQQVIKISNGVKPVISGCKAEQVCTYDSECLNGFIELEVTATDDCTDASNLRWRYQVFAGELGLGPVDFTNPVIDTTGDGDTANASGKYPIGSHIVRWTFFDRCGNATTCDQPFTIQSCKAATAYCINGLAVDLMPMDTDNDGDVDFGMVELWASDFDAGSYHPCGLEVFLSFSPDTSERNITFDCTNIGMNSVDIYASVAGPEGILIQSFCTSFIDVQDNTGACVGMRPLVDVDGEVYTEELEKVEHVDVSLVGSNLSDETNNTGEYAFPNMPMGGQYTVNPYSNESPLNGVSTLDLITIQRHILGDVALDSPYKIIAADINNDNSLTAIDLIELRKLILGVYDEYPNNDSWRFVDQSYTFVDPTNPFNETFMEDYVINNLDSDMHIDFIAVKVGDVNSSVIVDANATDIDKRNNSTVQITYSDMTVEMNEIVEVPFTINKNDISGFQMAINFDSDLLTNVELANVNNTLDASNYRIVGDQILISWNTNTTIDNNEIFIVRAQANTSGSIADAFSVDNRLITPEVYTSNGDINLPVINVEGGDQNSLEFRLYPNQPNPFSVETEVRFSVPNDGDVQITVVDVEGRIVQSDKAYYTAGTHAVRYEASDLGTAGIYYLTIKTNNDNATMKMVMLK